MSGSLFFADLIAKGMALLDPETAHSLTIKMLKTGAGSEIEIDDPSLHIRVAGIDFQNPIGLAAGFDKNAEVPNAMLDLGFSHVEIGAVTPRAQPGNPRPRVFRLPKDRAVINRYGFNNDGVDAVSARLRVRQKRGVVGANLGANKDSRDRLQDYVIGIERLAGLVDYFSINISSPNTPGLRALHGKAELSDLLDRALSARRRHAPTTPVFLKISPDVTDEDKADLVALAPKTELDGLIISNTTVSRPAGLDSPHGSEAGGLSGAPLFESSTRLLREFYQALGGEMALIGVGGVSSTRHVYEKILAGASLVQLYTALVYQGPHLPLRMLTQLPKLLAADGFRSVREAIGKGAV